MRFLLVVSLLFAVRALPAAAQSQKDMRTREQKREGLVRESLAGQNVPVMPLTMVVRDSAVSDSVLLTGRPVLMAWADSILADGLTLAAPEISWVYGAELTRVARRGAGMIPEPAKMGQAILRSESIKTVPDPTRANFRTLAGLAGARFIFVPAAVRFTRDSTGQSWPRSAPCSPIPGRARCSGVPTRPAGALHQAPRCTRPSSTSSPSSPRLHDVPCNTDPG